MSIYTLFAVVLCNMATLRASRVLVSLFAIELGASQFYIGLLIAMYSVFPMLLALFAGRLADRLGVRPPMMIGSIGVGLGLLLPYLFPSVAVLYISAAFIGASHVFFNVSAQNTVGMLSTDDSRTANFSNYGLVMSTGTFLGPIAAGFSIDHYGYVATYLYLALVPLIPAFLLWRARGLKDPGLTTKEERGAGNTRDLWNNVRLRRTLISSAIILTGIDLFQFYMPIYGHSVGLSASAIGIVLGCFAVASFVVRVGMTRVVKRFGEDRVLITALYCGAAAFLVFPFFTQAVPLAIVSFILGLGMGCSQPLSIMLIYSRAPEGRSGEALGLRLTLNNFMHIAVPLAFGTIGSLVGVGPVFAVNAAILAAGGMLSSAATRKAG